MIITTRTIRFKPPFDFGMLLMSDLHVGGSKVDYSLMQEELDDARKNNYRIAINGDVFDAIFPGDRKRFRMTVLHDRLLAAGDRLLDAAIDWAFEILRPVADLIDMIGVGNHDDKVSQIHHSDPVQRLVVRLNDYLERKGDSHRINYGGYTGWIGYRFERRKHIGWQQIDSIRIMYHHGSGAAAPVTKGTIDFNRSNVWIQEADIVWKGHKHNKLFFHDRCMALNHECNKVITRSRLNVMTGAYGEEYIEQDQDSIAQRGRSANYAVDALMAPQGKGGFIIKAHFDVDNHRRLAIEDKFIHKLEQFSEDDL